MKKRFLNKALALMLCAFTVAPMAACGGSNGGETIDETKTQLNVWHYFAGFRDEWLVELKTNFEEAMKDVSFEEGKKGVQINHRGEVKSDWTVTQVKDSQYDVFFMESPDNFYSIMKGGALEPLNSIITVGNENDDNQTIESKMAQSQKDYYCQDGQYYGIPHYSGSYGIIYNKDLFDEKGLYLAAEPDTETGSVLISESNPTKSNGLDGVAGTEDDGLPTTYDEFFQFCKAINNRQVDALAFPGGQTTKQHIGGLVHSLVAANEGAEQMRLNYTLEGTATTLGSIQDGEFVKDESATTITPENAYELARQEGKYNAFDFAMKLLGNDDYYNEDLAENTSVTHTNCQSAFLQYGTDLDNRTDAKANAMLIDGTWWQMEAEATFAYMGNVDSKYSKANRSFGWMPLPQATAEEAAKIASGEKKNVFTDCLNAVSCVRSGLSDGVKKAALAFLQYAYTDEALCNFTYTTGALIGMDYLDELNQNNLNYYVKSLVNYVKNADKVYQVSSSEHYIKNLASISSHEIYGVSNYNSIVNAVWDGNMTATDFFTKHKAYYKGLAW